MVLNEMRGIASYGHPGNCFISDFSVSHEPQASKTIVPKSTCPSVAPVIESDGVDVDSVFCATPDVEVHGICDVVDGTSEDCGTAVLDVEQESWLSVSTM